MFTHLHHFNLPLNLEYLYRFDVLLSHYLDSDLEAGPLMRSELDLPELALTNCLFKLVVAVQVSLSNGVRHRLNPLHLLVFRLEVEDA